MACRHKQHALCHDDKTVMKCLQHIYMCDSKGLVTTSRGDKLPDHKMIMARKDDTPNMKDLTEIVKHVKPHAVVGLTGGGEAWGKVYTPPFFSAAQFCPCLFNLFGHSVHLSALLPPRSVGMS